MLFAVVGLLCGVHWSVVGPIVAFAASTTLWWFRSVLSPLCWALVLAIFTLARPSPLPSTRYVMSVVFSRIVVPSVSAARRRFLRWSCSAASAVVLALVFEWTFFPSLSFLFARALYRSCFLFLLFTAGVNFFGRLSDAWALRIIGPCTCCPGAHLR